MKDGNRIAKRMLRLEPNNFFLVLTSMQKRLLHSKPSSKKKMKKEKNPFFCPEEQLRCFSPSAKKSSILSDLTNLKTELLLMKLKEESSWLHKWNPDIFDKKHISVLTLGIGGGASGRTTAFYLSKPSSNPGTNLIFSENEVNLFSPGVGLSLKNVSYNEEYPLSLFFPLSYHHHLKN